MYVRMSHGVIVTCLYTVYTCIYVFSQRDQTSVAIGLQDQLEMMIHIYLVLLCSCLVRGKIGKFFFFFINIFTFHNILISFGFIYFRILLAHYRYSL